MGNCESCPTCPTLSRSDCPTCNCPTLSKSDCPTCDCPTISTSTSTITPTITGTSGPWYFFMTQSEDLFVGSYLSWTDNTHINRDGSSGLFWTSPDFMLPDPPNLTNSERTFRASQDGVSDSGDLAVMNEMDGSFTYRGSLFTLMDATSSGKSENFTFLIGKKNYSCVVICIGILLIMLIIILFLLQKNKNK